MEGESYLCTVSTFSSAYTLVVLTPADYIFADSHLYITQGILIGVLVIVQMLIYAWVIAHLFTRRIEVLHKSVRQFAEDMTPIQAPETADDEIGQLSAECAHMSTQIVSMIEQLKKNGRERKRLELAALRSQFDPHMLYNTLNTITYLAKLQEAPNIQEVSEAFSRLLRTLSKNTDEFVPISQELSYIADYITIKKYNLLNEITLTFSVDEALRDRPIIKLLLQPFVENAVVHGFANMVRPARLEIRVFGSGGFIHIRIADNGCGMEPEVLKELLEAVHAPQASDHIGIPNTVRRFALTYEFRYFFDIQSEPGRYTIVELAYPDRNEREEDDAEGTVSR